MTWSPGQHEDGTCSCHPSSVQSVCQTLDEMDFERGMETLGKDAEAQDKDRMTSLNYVAVFPVPCCWR